MSDLPTPINRHEQYLNAIATGNADNLPTPPITREEVFLDYIARNGGGGGGGAVTGVKGSAESTYRTGNVDISASNIGLGNVDNTSDLNKPISTATQTALNGKVNTSSVGSANGVAELDANGRVPSSQLPSYVDDVLEYADLAHFPATGETGKIYIAEDTNKTYRWSGSGFVEISESLALGETSSTAYAGNKGKANADAITAIKDGTNLDSFADVENAFNYLTFEGTQADWNLLSTAEKKKYKQAIFTDDYDDNPVGNLNALTTTDKSSCVGAINEVNGRIAFDDWLPSNGFNPLTECDGWFCYSVHPSLQVYQGTPNGNSEYGTVFGCSKSNYGLLVHIDVFGKIAVWSHQENQWVKYTSAN